MAAPQGCTRLLTRSLFDPDGQDEPREHRLTNTYMASKAKKNDSSERTEAQEQDRSLDLSREEKIRRRAYELYLERGGEPGHQLADWQAEEHRLNSSHEFVSRMPSSA